MSVKIVSEFFAIGTPKGQPRPRAFARKFGSVYSARVFDPGTAEAWKGDIARAAMPAKPEEPIEGPVWLEVDFLFPRPKSLMRKKDAEGEIPHASKPDRDNCEKALLDALTQLGFWKDDCQVSDGPVRKFYVAKNGTPGARVRIGVIEI